MRTYADEVRQLRDFWRGKGWTLPMFQHHVTRLARRPVDWHTIEDGHGTTYRTWVGQFAISIHDHAGHLSLTVAQVDPLRAGWFLIKTAPDADGRQADIVFEIFRTEDLAWRMCSDAGDYAGYPSMRKDQARDELRELLEAGGHIVFHEYEEERPR